MQDYYFYGLRLKTDILLKGLPASTVSMEGVPFVLRQGPVPERLPGTSDTNSRFARDASGRVLIKFPPLLRLLLVDENEAVIEIEPDASLVEVEGYLLSYVAGLVLHRRRSLTLHASCVRIEGRAVVISGHSGGGKSTLATALDRAGHVLLSDDITVIRFAADGRALAIPGSPHPRLNADSIAATALDRATLANGRIGDGKKIWYRDHHHMEPISIAALIRLDIAPPGEGPALTRLSGAGALLPLQELVYRFTLGRRLGNAGDLAYGCLRLAAQVPIYRLRRSHDFSALDETLRLVLQIARNIEGPDAAT